MKLWRRAVLKSYAERKVEIDESAVPEDEPLLGDSVPLRIVMVVVAEDEWHRRDFDFSLVMGDQNEAIRWMHFCDAYTGSWILQ